MNIIRVDSVASTNDHARKLLADGRLAGRAAIIAREQTAGRGTGGRSWLSPRDAGIYMTVVDPAPVGTALPATTAYTQAAGVACVETIAEAIGIRLTIKPVNDMMHRGAKVGGILTEAVFVEGCLATVLVGIGINTRACERTLPPEVPPAGSLEEISDTRSRLDEALLAEAIARHCFAWHDTLVRGGQADVARAWRACLV